MVVLVFASSCGKTGNSSKVKFEISPDQPIVIDTDLKYTRADGEEITVKAPWFLANIKITNDSDKVLSILVIKMESRGTFNGAPAEQTVEYTQDEEVDFLSGEETFGQLVYVDPGETKTFVAYFDGHAKTTNDAFSVRATFTGWFSDPPSATNRLNPNERFENQLSFYAR